MTVKELREELAECPDDAEVFVYVQTDEGDGRLEKVTVETAICDTDDGDETEELDTPYYCQGDSDALRYWAAFGPNTPIVFLASTDTYHNYEKEALKQTK